MKIGTTRAARGLWGALAMLACSEPMDLGTNSRWVDIAEDAESAEPQTIYDNGREHVFGLATQDDELYALVEHNGGFQLTSCPVDSCRSKRRILYEGAKLSWAGRTPIPLVVSGEHIAWAISDPYLASVVICSTAGCEKLTLVEARDNVGLSGLVADAEGFYWREGESLWRAAWGDLKPRLVWNSRPFGELVARGAFLFYTTSEGLYRVRKDGSADPEVLAEDAQIQGLAVGEDALYYTTKTLAGRIVRCRWGIARCDDRSLVAGQRFPAVLRQSMGELYWLAFPQFGNQRDGDLWSCTLPACDDARQRVHAVPVFLPEYASEPLVLSRTSVVWLAEQGRDGMPNEGSLLWRLPR